MLAAGGRFRADLLDRLAFDVIHIPPLRVRAEDILTLAYHFAVNVTSELKREFFPGFSSRATATLLAHPWPGNVRELKNAVERSVYRADDTGEPIEGVLFDPFASPFDPLSPAGDSEPSESDTERRAAVSAVDFPLDFKEAVAGFETGLLQEALRRSHFNQRITAELLGLTYDQLRGLVRKYEPRLQ